MYKKGIESVEVWMWLIAGMIIGSLIFVSGYSLLSHWIHNNEVNQATQNFGLLKSSIINVCSIGYGKQEIKSYVFPRSVNNITIKDEYDNYGEGHILCLDMKNEPLQCSELDEKPNSCKYNVTMDSLSFNEQKTLFSTIQKALGEEQASKIEFTISKEKVNGKYKIKISWKEKFIK